MSTLRSILVTGSNQGLGMHTVHKLASTPNVLVFMGSRKLAAAEEARAKFATDINSSSTVVPVQLDITDDTSIQNAHAFIANHLKEQGLRGLDVLINNAGRVGTFEEVYAVNVFGAVAITEAIRPLLNNGGAILNISSKLGSLKWHTERPPPRIFLAYSSSKSALNSLTLQWAIQEEQKSSGIRVVSICPGYNATNLNNYGSGAMSPAEGCMIIVKTALEKEGRSGVYFNKHGDLAW
ncbi:hypothetical protein B0H17DRAFT_643756 [Mycena rosella]|uniref:NAD(P)-binding protein n=1 Tax=Mycena rosella TaxID=1033263 RepID=A0AAD7DDU8_MYCRO|nr:hypothetical protein B0H17DRAFT_643756 [Mycena rosella]